MRHTLIILFLAISSVVSATTYYVSSSGNNANNGLTTATPWQTIQYAELHAVNPGDIIALKRGDIWSTDLTLGIYHGGTSSSPIVWDGHLWGTGEDAIILATGNRTAPNYSVVNIIGCSYVTFQHIVIDGGHHQLFGLVVGGVSHFYSNGIQNNETGIKVQDCTVKNIGDGTVYSIGILVQCEKTNVSNITIQRNLIENVGSHGISLYPRNEEYLGGEKPKEIINSYVGYNTITNYREYSGNTGFGIHINHKCTNTIVEYNTVTDVMGTNSCIVMDSQGEPGYYQTGTIIRYNKVHAKVYGGIAAFGGQPVTASIYGNVVTNFGSSAGRTGIDIHPSYNYTGASFNVFNNTILVDNGAVNFYDGSSVAGCTKFNNNILWNTGTNLSVIITTSGSTVHSNNLYYKSGTGNVLILRDGSSYIYKDGIASWESTVRIGDPLFVNSASDWHLKAGSPAIGSGIAIPGITKDIEGKTINNPPDIGCYQSPASSVPPPVYINSVLNESSPDIIEMAYDLSLANIVPQSTSFNVKVNSVNRALTSVAIDGTVVKLTLTSQIIPGDIASVSYTKPVSNPLQSTVGGLAASISTQPVTNNLLTAVPTVQDSPAANIKITIYPNPVHHILNILCEYTGTYSVQDATNSPNSIRIMDISGKLVFQRSLEPGRTNQQIPINLRSGVYVVLLLSRGLTLSSQKIIVYN